ncbi:Vacuolar protein sorting-associated protein 51 [Penicillium griseofulvum]|uniref:Conserved oligomeric Golgi complex subunit 1 n=1 Tax=Penicillium patulum TaxID=5078 RepID=A0A135LN34_PENPA|nr:Vacuolar protein sorting-associated protein 51 [Penicillium griseofulvum]KXG50376.1 Vacuolar protein sorting-associated protein 51 [Penicillium griseofulvum]
MAPEAPDPQSLKSWHDAFQYPIPTVRRVEQELRRDIASNKEKLRALVGTRYRDLVGTAETIVAMNRDIQDVESILADVGRRCNPRLIERRHVHVRQIKSGDAEKDAEKHSFGAQLSLLHRCTTSASRLLRRRSSLLLVAKILVVSRSLHKALSQHESLPPFIHDLRNQLASLWRILFKRIDKRLASTNATDDTIIESLAAYCLATSSSSDDAIDHFHQVRLDVIVSQLDVSSENIPKALQLFVQTLQASKVLRSRQFPDVLSKLKARPLLADPEIQSLDGLEVEVLGRWVAPDVKNFTPWVKLSELSRVEGVESTKEWSLQAFTKFSEGCQKSLAQSTDFSELLSLRAETVELWLSSWGSTIIHSSVDVLGSLRNIFNNQLSRILNMKAQSLGDVGTQVSSIISNWEKTDHNSVGSLWDADLITAEYSNGAQAFKQTVADRLLGRDEDISTVLTKYESWLASIQEVNEFIDSLRRTRWTDILLGGEVEDGDIDITPRLNEDDPRYLSESLHSAVRDAFTSLQASFNSAFKSFDSLHSSEKATFLLRLIRLVRRDIPAGFVSGDFVFSSEIVPDLQKLLATEVVAKAGSLSLIPLPKTNPQTGKIKTVPGRSLWEGEPAIPVQPSASSFKLLRRLTSSMDICGLDLWDPSTMQALKLELKMRLEAAISSALDDLDSEDVPRKAKVKDGHSTANGDKDKEDKTTEKSETPGPGPDQAEALRDWKVQLFFDSLYLSQMLGERNQLSGAIERAQKSSGANAETVKTIKRLATEYWTRTELLFGLLAGH